LCILLRVIYKIEINSKCLILNDDIEINKSGKINISLYELVVFDTTTSTIRNDRFPYGNCTFDFSAYFKDNVCV